jgi:hypothetical protein
MMSAHWRAKTMCKAHLLVERMINLDAILVTGHQRVNELLNDIEQCAPHPSARRSCTRSKFVDKRQRPSAGHKEGVESE